MEHFNKDQEGRVKDAQNKEIKPSEYEDVKVHAGKQSKDQKLL